MDYRSENPGFHADESITFLPLKPARKHFDEGLKKLDLARSESKRTAHFFRAQSDDEVAALPTSRHESSTPLSVLQEPSMPITEEIVDAFVRCETKAHLKLDAVPGIPSELSRWQHSMREAYRKECNELLRSALQWV
jgi:hypothetical protein